MFQGQEYIKLLEERIKRKKELIKTNLEKIEKCRDMVKKSETATLNKMNNEKDAILKLRIIEYEKQRIDELNRFIFDLVEIKQQK